MKREQVNRTREEELARFLKKLEQVKREYQEEWDLKGFKRLGQRMIEFYAGEKEDIEVVKAVLPHLETVFPIKQHEKMVYHFEDDNIGMKHYQCSVITENPENFRMLIKSKKIDLSPRTMYLIYENEKTFSTLQQNLLEILVLLKKYELVKILLEYINLEEWMRIDEENGLRTYAVSVVGKEPKLSNYDNQFDNLFDESPFCETCISKNEKKTLLELAFLTEDAKMCDLLIEHNVSNVKEIFKKSFNSMPVEFVEYFLKKSEQYKKFLNLREIIKFTNFQMLPIYIEQFGLQTTKKKLLKYMKEQTCDDLIYDGSLFYAIKEMKEYCKDQKSKTQIEKVENEFFQYVDSVFDELDPFINDNLLPYYLEYKIKQDYPISEKVWRQLTEVYLFDFWEKELEKKRKKGFYDKKQLNKKTQELFNHEKKGLFITKKAGVSNVKVKRFRELLTVLNSNRYDKIEKTEGEDGFFGTQINLSFLAAILYKDSISLVRQAWKNNFIHSENLDDAIQFALEHKKEKSLSVLLEYSGAEDVP